MQDRTSEWFVPKFGPRNFRISVGLMFLPYTGIVTCFASWGSLVEQFLVERTIAICVIYFLAVGVSAHCLDAVGGSTKPWGDLPKRRVIAIALLALGVAFSIGLYYAFWDSPLLIPIGIAEGFFLFAYNLELFNGRFHNNFFTIISWGILPVFAGSAIQTNSISPETILLASVSGIITLVLITISRRYKELLRSSGDPREIKSNERRLKLITFLVLAATSIFIALRIFQ